MNIVTFCDVDTSLIDSKNNVEHFHTGTTVKADIAILDINSIFDFEENKHQVCNENFASIAVIDDDSDYEAFKNFGIDAWIKGEDIKDINGIINLIEKRLLS